MSSVVVQKLRLNSAFRDWPLAEVTVLALAVQVRELRQGTRLCEEGKPGSVCWLVLSGSLEVFRQVGGRQVSVAKFSAGDWVGQVALLDGAPRSGTVEAATDCELVMLTRDVFQQLLTSHAPVALRFQRQVAVAGSRQLRMATEQFASLLGVVARRGKLTEEDLSQVRRRRSRSTLPRPTEIPASWLTNTAEPLPAGTEAAAASATAPAGSAAASAGSATPRAPTAAARTNRSSPTGKRG